MVHGPPSIWGKTTLGLSKNLGENHGKKKTMVYHHMSRQFLLKLLLDGHAVNELAT
jgi:hypothetical protein